MFKAEKEMFIIGNYRIKPLRTENIPQNDALYEYARRNRGKGYISEVVFWKQVHKKKFHGIDFNRQYIIGNYIVDFYARSLSLVVEIDGGSHNDRLDYDAYRDQYMRSLGLKLFRTTDFDVMNNLDIVMCELEQFIILNYEHE